jgi:hypothetical protein
MEGEVKRERPPSSNITAMFDATLCKHLERLIGTRYGIGALPLNVVTISFLILLAEQEKEIERFSSDSPKRYTRETLINELSSMGLNPVEGLETELQEMIQKGYIDVDEDGRLVAEKPTISMGQLLDRIFPRMAGINLIAYFVQTLEEVQSGRKGPDSANSYVDQILQMHGVPLAKQAVQSKPKKALRRPVEHKTKLWKQDSPHISRTEPKIISSNANPGNLEIRELFTDQYDSPESPNITPPAGTEGSSTEPELSPETSSQLLSEPLSDKDNLPGEAACKDRPLETVSAARDEPLHISEPEKEEAELIKDLDIEVETPTSLQSEAPSQQPESGHEPEIVAEEHVFETADDIIEKKITSFEAGLTMQCPICRSAEIQINKTATGKTYYRCSDRDCIFISWGKPYHLVCPLCRNPFLVEISDRNGKTILKCPRATCRYWQRPPEGVQGDGEGQGQLESTPNSSTPRKRAVRRRVVRRRRTKAKKA